MSDDHEAIIAGIADHLKIDYEPGRSITKLDGQPISSNNIISWKFVFLDKQSQFLYSIEVIINDTCFTIGSTSLDLNDPNFLEQIEQIIKDFRRDRSNSGGIASGLTFNPTTGTFSQWEKSPPS